MDLSDTTRTLIQTMARDGGRLVNGRWRSTENGQTLLCKDGNHGTCGGWIFPTGGPNECDCPCHDEHRPPYHDALKTVVKKTDDWKIGDCVTIDGPDTSLWQVTFINRRARIAHVKGSDGQVISVSFLRLELHCRP